MELSFSKSNNIRTSYTVDAGVTGSAIQHKQYSVDLGAILYNDAVLDLSSLTIPLRDQTFFDLPQDKNKYAVINVYYDFEGGHFVFDKLGVFDKYVEKITARALFRVIPIAQFVLRENSGNFEVISYNEYSQMSTFTITDTFIQGETGSKADSGADGVRGVQGIEGDWGSTGPVGDTGDLGITGLSLQGPNGPVGETGVYIDTDLLLYYKFKTSDPELIDYSPYERDSFFSYTGAFSDEGAPLSYFTKEPGVVDFCHNVVYGGGYSAYVRREFFEFGRETGTLSAWVKLTEKPVANFSFFVDPLNPLRIHFRDASGKNPTSWMWWMKYDPSYYGEELGDVLTVQNPIYTFPDFGTYIVKLRAINSNGYSEIARFVVVSVGGPVFYDLTMSVTGNGTTDPTGTIAVEEGALTPIVAEPAVDYSFVNWTFVGDAEITDPNAPSTTVILSGDATVTANFVVTPPDAYFIWEVDS